MRVFSVWAAVLVLSGVACGLETAWRYDAPTGLGALPNVIDSGGSGAINVIVPTLCDGTVRVLDAQGAPIGQYSVDRWIQGNAAVCANPSLVAFEDSSGRITIHDLASNAQNSAMLEGKPPAHGGLCLADLDADGRPEVVTVRRNGILGAFDTKLRPRWQYDAGAPMENPPVIAPVFKGCAGVYVCDAAGALHAVSGNGLPLWRFRIQDSETSPAAATPRLVVQLDGNENPSVVVTSADGQVIAVDAVEGREQWRVQIGTQNPGCPALLGHELVIVNCGGAITHMDGVGRVAGKAQLPAGDYGPMPLIADVDGDGTPELLVPTANRTIAVATLSGTVKEQLTLRGVAANGLLLADLDRDGSLELLATTDLAALHCFKTRAKEGWANPKVNACLNGYIPPIAPSDLPAPARPLRRVRIDSMAVNSYDERSPVGAVFLRTRQQKSGRYLSAVIHSGARILGSTFRPNDPRGVPVPFVRNRSAGLSIDLRFYDDRGRMVASSSDIALHSGAARIVELPPLEAFLETLGACGDRYAVPKAWDLPRVRDRDFWPVVRYTPDVWDHSADIALFTEAAHLIGLESSDNAAPMFGPHHKDWAAIAASPTPFFLECERDKTVTRADYEAIVKMAGARFQGFLAYDADALIRKRWNTSLQHGAEGRDEFAAAIEKDLEELSAENYSRLSVRQDEFLFHHHALAEGALASFAEIGRDVSNASLRFAFLRGAARQCATRPWGVSVNPVFRGAYPLDGYSGVNWDSPRRQGIGPDCGHSLSLLFRLPTAAFFAGATYIQRDPDPRLDATAPGRNYSLHLREDAKKWRAYVSANPKRGVPYTPFAVMLDSRHTWKPGALDTSAKPTTDENAAIDAFFRHIFAGDTGGDFEQGFLTNGPYGEVFDVITQDASAEALAAYGIIWPLGNVSIKGNTRERLVQYVKNGGILVLNANLAKAFAPEFQGLRFEPTTEIASQIQTSLAAFPPIAAPYVFQSMTPSRNTEVLAWTDTGHPLLTWRNVGEGVVIAAATDTWLDERGHLLPLAPGVLRACCEVFLPVQPPGDVQMFLNRQPDGWTIALINNNGVAKSPTLAASTDPAQAADCILHFRKGVPLQFLSCLGEFAWNNRANGLHTRLQPGEVAVVKAVFGNE